MKHTSFYYIANWKMQFTFNDAIAWIEKYKRDLTHFGLDRLVVICPSFPVLSSVTRLLSQTKIVVGAQNCSSYDTGPFTGEVDAKSLHELGCRYCILGHSERRILFGETDEVVVAKVRQCLINSLYPIVCIGETLEQRDAGLREQILEQQLAMIFKETRRWSGKKILIAYEPVWAIGSGVTPDAQDITQVIAHLQELVTLQNDKNQWEFLYGGSVSGTNVADLKRIKTLAGFLIGTASLDFQELKKIVS